MFNSNKWRDTVNHEVPYLVHSPFTSPLSGPQIFFHNISVTKKRLRLIYRAVMPLMMSIYSNTLHLCYIRCIYILPQPCKTHKMVSSYNLQAIKMKEVWAWKYFKRPGSDLDAKSLVGKHMLYMKLSWPIFLNVKICNFSIISVLIPCIIVIT